MKSTSRLLVLLSIVLVVIILLNALPFIKSEWISLHTGKSATSPTVMRTPSPPSLSQTTVIDASPNTITVSGQQWGNSTCYIGATEGSSRFAIADLEDLGINSYHIYGGMSRWEAQDDSSVYGYPTIAQIKANPNVINWKQWDTVMTNPPDGSDYSWEPAPRWQGNARTLFSELNAAHIRIILTLRNRDDQNNPSWSPDPPQTTAGWNEWWEHVFATVYWLDVRNNYDVTDFEIHNEPNIPGQGWTPEATEAQYYNFAKYTDDAISYVFHTYMPGRSFHVYAPATSNSTWPRDMLHNIPQYFDSMDVHIYGDFRYEVEQVHNWLNQAGYAKEPLWVTEWGSYNHQYNSEPFGISIINELIYGSFPGNDYVYGSDIFSLYDFSTNATGLIDYKGNRRVDYYALRMGIRALQGCRPTYQSITGNKNLLAITTTDAQKNVYLLVTNQSSNTSYTVHANLSALLTRASGVMWQFDNSHMDTIVGKPSLVNGNILLTIPASGAVLVKFLHSI
ncbi:MAG TPA: hypothetical protein VNE38_16020 [Ktedonobacteraceae bacterium]|nr:hypothetical protein [Ktedonobacteraceae bacterium]